jgi:hypothetical protein
MSAPIIIGLLTFRDGCPHILFSCTDEHFIHDLDKNTLEKEMIEAGAVNEDDLFVIDQDKKPSVLCISCIANLINLDPRVSHPNKPDKPFSLDKATYVTVRMGNPIV